LLYHTSSHLSAAFGGGGGAAPFAASSSYGGGGGTASVGGGGWAYAASSFLPPYPSTTPSMMSANTTQSAPCYYNPNTTNPILRLSEVTTHITALNQSAPFTMNNRTLLTEKAGKLVNEQYTPTVLSWLFNPLICYSVLPAKKAAMLFPPMPSDKQLINVGHQPCNFNNIIKVIRELFTAKTCNIHLQDIPYLPEHNYLYFSHSLQQQVIHALENHAKHIQTAPEIFTFEKFSWEREIMMQQHASSSNKIIQPQATPKPNSHKFRNMIFNKHCEHPFTRSTESVMSSTTTDIYELFD
jgi:hypothetical protein